MKIRLIKDDSIVLVEDTWGERLVEQGKAVPAGPESEEPQAETAVRDEAPPADAKKPAEDGAKAETAKKTGKKR